MQGEMLVAGWRGPTWPSLHAASPGRDAGRDGGLAAERGRDTRVEDEDDAVDEDTERRGLQGP